MTTSSQQSGRPLPAGVVGLSSIDRGQRTERRDAAPSGTLLVGQGIQVKGQIEACQTLVVEGRVEAALAANALDVLKGGLFQGTAEVEKAVIAGTFDGDLTVRDQLTIKAGGRASGKIRYGRVTIETGGEISGDVATSQDDETENQVKGNVA